MKNHSKDIVNRNLEVFAKDIVTEDGTLNERALRSLCENIEREVRHLAMSNAFALAHAIKRGVDVEDSLRRLRAFEAEKAEK